MAPIAAGKAALKVDQCCPDFWQCGDPAGGLPRLKRAQVTPVQVLGLQAAGGQRRISALHPDRAIKQPGVQVTKPEALRDGATDRALARRCRSIDCHREDHACARSCARPGRRMPLAGVFGKGRIVKRQLPTSRALGLASDRARQALEIPAALGADRPVLQDFCLESGHECANLGPATLTSRPLSPTIGHSNRLKADGAKPPHPAGGTTDRRVHDG